MATPFNRFTDYTYTGANGVGVNVDGTRNYESLKGRTIDGHELNKYLNEIKEFAQMDFETFIKEFYDRLDNDGQTIVKYIASDAIRRDNFITDAIVPLLTIRYLATLTSSMKSNFNACHLLSVNLVPSQIPNPNATIKYILEKEEIPLPIPGTVRQNTGTNMKQHMEMIVTMEPYTLGIYIDDLESMNSVNRGQLLQKLQTKILKYGEAWKAMIARLHYLYVAGQPTFADLMLSKESYVKHLTHDRSKLGTLLDMIDLHNSVEGALNRDINYFSALSLACCNSIKDLGNEHILVVPKRLLPEVAGNIVIARLSYAEQTYEYNTSQLDGNSQKLNVEWSKNLVTKMTGTPEIKRFHIAQTTCFVGYQSFYTTMQDSSGDFMYVPAIRLGPENLIPIIQLDDQPLYTDGPSMEQPMVQSLNKRYWYTVGAVPQNYHTFRSQQFYKHESSVTMSDIACRSPSSTFIVNYEETAVPCEVRLQQLHKYANSELHFNLDHYRDSVNKLPQDLFENENMDGVVLKSIEQLFLQPDSSIKLTNKYCLLEFSPRNVCFPKLMFGNAYVSEREDRPRMCLWNATAMSTVDAEFVGVLSSLVKCLGTNCDLEEYLILCQKGLNTPTPIAIQFLIFIRMVLARNITDAGIRTIFSQTGIQTTHVMTALAAHQQPQLQQGVTQINYYIGKTLLQYFNHILHTKGITLALADVYCQVFFVTMVDKLAANTDIFKMYPDLEHLYKLSDMQFLFNLRDIITRGQNLFLQTINRLPTNLLNHIAMPYNLLALITPIFTHNLKFINLFNNLFAAQVCNKELVIRYDIPSDDLDYTPDVPSNSSIDSETSTRKRTYGKRTKKPVIESDTPSFSNDITDERNIFSHTHVNSFNRKRSPLTYYMDVQHDFKFNTKTGFIELNNQTNFDDQDYTYYFKSTCYRNSFYCNSDFPLANIVNQYLNALPNDTSFRQLGDIPVFESIAGGHMAGLPFVFDVSPVRATMTSDNYYTTQRFLHTASSHPQVPNIDIQPFDDIHTPVWLARRCFLKKELCNFPLFTFYMAIHYFTDISYENIIEHFDCKYYSGWAYLCIRDMEYTGYSIAAMPLQGSLFVTGNRQTLNVSTSPMAVEVNGSMRMGIVPGHMGSHGCVMPNVFLSNTSGLNCVFINPEDLTVSGSRMGTTAQQTAVNNLSIILDWCNSMVPPTYSGTHKTCEAVLPLAGRYVNVTPSDATDAHYLNYKDVPSHRYCESPTLLSFADRVRYLESLASRFTSAGLTCNSIVNFISAMSYYHLEDTAPDMTLLSSPTTGAMRQAALLQKAVDCKPLQTPFMTHLGLMFADSYVIGENGGNLLQYNKKLNWNPSDIDLNVRIVGQGLSPSQMFDPDTTGAFLTRFSGLTNIPFMANIYNMNRNVSDLTAVAQTKI